MTRPLKIALPQRCQTIVRFDDGFREDDWREPPYRQGPGRITGRRADGTVGEWTFEGIEVMSDIYIDPHEKIPVHLTTQLVHATSTNPDARKVRHIAAVFGDRLSFDAETDYEYELDDRDLGDVQATQTLLESLGGTDDCDDCADCQDS